uniref:glycosyltransferase n=1 Tax=Flavobacterium sp. TaxID=239 RepID=UPI00404B3100
MRKIRIAHVNNITQLSGSQVVSIEILKALPDSKYEKYIICGYHKSGYNEFIALCEAVNINCIIMDSQLRQISFRDLLYFKELYNLIKANRFDIVHTNSTKPGLVGRIAAKLSNVPLILHTVHGITFHRNNFIFKRVFLYLFDLFGTLFCDYQVLVNKYYQKYYSWIPWVKTFTIYNGISITDAILSDILRVKLINKKFTVLFIGRLEAQKDPLTFLKSIQYLKTLSPDIFQQISFRVIGEGDLFSKCSDYITNNVLGPNVSLENWTNEKWSAISNANIICAPSIFEAFGLVFLEAGICRIPVIATCVEGIPEVVIHSKTGFLIKPGDFIEMAEFILQLFNDRSLLSWMGNNSFERVSTEFKISTTTRTYEKIYENLNIK